MIIFLNLFISKKTDVPVWSKHTIIIPVNSNNDTHWELWVIHGLDTAASPSSKIHVLVFDSMNTSSKKHAEKQKYYFDLLKFYIDLSAKNEFSEKVYTEKRLSEIVFVKVACPQQPDSFNQQVLEIFVIELKRIFYRNF